jgi:hypothetical protein
VIQGSVTSSRTQPRRDTPLGFRSATSISRIQNSSIVEDSTPVRSTTEIQASDNTSRDSVPTNSVLDFGPAKQPVRVNQSIRAIAKIQNSPTDHCRGLRQALRAYTTLLRDSRQQEIVLPRERQRRNSEQYSASYSKLGVKPTTSGQYWKTARRQTGGPAAIESASPGSVQQRQQVGVSQFLAAVRGSGPAVAPREHRVSDSDSTATAAARQHSTAAAGRNSASYSRAESRVMVQFLFTTIDSTASLPALNTAFTTRFQHSVHYQ